MPYTPTIEKLHALGFHSVKAVYTDEQRYWRYQDAVDAPGLEWVVSIYPDEQIHLIEAGGWVGLEEGEAVFIGHCASEQFFDELLTAVGWPSIEPATKPLDRDS